MLFAYVFVLFLLNPYLQCFSSPVKNAATHSSSGTVRLSTGKVNGTGGPFGFANATLPGTAPKGTASLTGFISGSSIVKSTGGTGRPRSANATASSGLHPTSPSGTGSKPSGTGSKPSGTGSKPSGTGSKPSGTGSKPSGTGSKPSGTGSKPSGTGSKPSGTGSKPSGTGSKPSGTGSKPSGTGSKPSGTGSKPSGTGSKPSGTGSKPSGTGSKPSGTGSKPSGTGSKPSGTGSNPSGTGSKPSGTGSKPSGTGSKPSGTGSKPSGTGGNNPSTNSTTSTPLPGTGVLPFSVTSVPTTVSVPITFNGTWSASTTAFPESYQYFLVPTTTITGAAETSEAALLGPLFLALQANREQITDPKLKSQFIDDVEHVQSELKSVFSRLPNPPEADPGCSNTKRKRDILSGITDIIGDAAKALSCADKVIGNLVDSVKGVDPSIDEIETLTDALAELGTDLENDEDDNNSSSSSSSKSSSSSCTASSVAPECTETISMSTTFMSSGSLTSSSVSTITSTVCSTVTACDAKATTATTTVSSSSSSTTGFFCAPTCLACVSDAPPAQTSSSLDILPREIDSRAVMFAPSRPDQIDRIVVNTMSRNSPAELNHNRVTPIYSTSKTVTWGNQPAYLWVAGLFGCTSVTIISQAGVWSGHFYEDPSFTNAANFPTQVINALKNGDPAGSTRFTSPFGLANNGILATGMKPQIFISTPVAAQRTDQTNLDDTNGLALLYQAQINEIVDTLTGNGAPWQGITPTVRGYYKPRPAEDNHSESPDIVADRMTALGKMLVEYENDVDIYDDEPPEKPQATWRIWLERSHYEPNPETWDALSGETGCSLSGNQKRSGDSCNVTLITASTLPASLDYLLTSGLASFPSTATTTGSNNTSRGPTGTGPKGTGPTGSGPKGTGPTGTAPTTKPGANSTIPSTLRTTSAPKTTLNCIPFEDPDQGDNTASCQCPGLTGLYPTVPSTSGQSGYNMCGYTTPPSPPTITAMPFTTTEDNGDVVSCATFSYFNYAVNTQKSCAGATAVVSTVASIASAYAVSTSQAAAEASARASSSAAEASWASTAAVPSAGCQIVNDDGFGDLSLQVYGINGWAGNDGSSLETQENGCGIFGNWQWYTNGRSMFDGKYRVTQFAFFDLSFVKSGCVERAIATAGGPPTSELHCQHGPPLDLPSNLQIKTANTAGVKDVVLDTAAQNNTAPSNATTSGSISLAQLLKLKAVAGGGWPNTTLSNGTTVLNVVPEGNSTAVIDMAAAASVAPPSPSLVSSAAAAVSHLMSSTATATGGTPSST